MKMQMSDLWLMGRPYTCIRYVVNSLYITIIRWRQSTHRLL